MTDLTAITTPFGLLDDATREALKAHGGPWEAFGVAGWSPIFGDCPFNQWIAYRVKPSPPKPREWVLCAGILHPCDVSALYLARRHPGEEVVRVREVTD
jgi:hypothetical protein